MTTSGKNVQRFDNLNGNFCMNPQLAHRASIPTKDKPVFCPGFQKGRVPSEKGTLAR